MGGEGGAGGEGTWPWGAGVGMPWPGSVIPDFTLPDTLERKCDMLLLRAPNELKLETFDITRRGEAIWKQGLASDALCDRH